MERFKINTILAFAIGLLAALPFGYKWYWEERVSAVLREADRHEMLMLRAREDLRETLVEQGVNLSYRNAEELVRAVLSAQNKYDLDVSLILGVIETESHFQVDAVSSKGAYGLMQLQWITAQSVAQEQGLQIDSPKTFLM